jgi:hypothetical protein
MNQYQIAIVALLALQAVTLTIMWQLYKERTWWQRSWTALAGELVALKAKRGFD